MKTFKSLPCVNLFLPVYVTLGTLISLACLDSFRRHQELLLIRDWLLLAHFVLLMIELILLLRVVWRLSRHLLHVSVDQDHTIDLVWMLSGRSVRWDQIDMINREDKMVCISLKGNLDKPIRFCLQTFDDQTCGKLWNALSLGAIMNDIPYQRA